MNQIARRRHDPTPSGGGVGDATRERTAYGNLYFKQTLDLKESSRTQCRARSLHSARTLRGET
jgi:hypothetical protein